jgi:hypothetical protein
LKDFEGDKSKLSPQMFNNSIVQLFYDREQNEMIIVSKSGNFTVVVGDYKLEINKYDRKILHNKNLILFQKKAV